MRIEVDPRILAEEMQKKSNKNGLWAWSFMNKTWHWVDICNTYYRAIRNNAISLRWIARLTKLWVDVIQAIKDVDERKSVEKILSMNTGS